MAISITSRVITPSLFVRPRRHPSLHSLYHGRYCNTQKNQVVDLISKSKVPSIVPLMMRWNGLLCGHQRTPKKAVNGCTSCAYAASAEGSVNVLVENPRVAAMRREIPIQLMEFGTWNYAGFVISPVNCSEKSENTPALIITTKHKNYRSAQGECKIIIAMKKI